VELVGKAIINAEYINIWEDSLVAYLNAHLEFVTRVHASFSCCQC
jgi:hypothetical protein